MRTIVVTGAAGFIGSHFCEALLNRKYRVFGIDNFDPFYDRRIKEANLHALKQNDGFTLQEIDIRDQNSLNHFFNNHSAALVVHLAAKAGVRPSLADPMGYADTNVTGTLNLLEEMRKSGIRNFLFASSSSVYGNNAKVPFSPDDRVDDPISPYAVTKRIGELLCSCDHILHDLNVACARLFTVFGPRQRPDLAIHHFTKQILKGSPIQLFGDDGSSRDYTYIDDIVAGLIACTEWLLARPNPVFEIFNLGSSSPITLIQLVRDIEKATKRTACIKWQGAQPGDVDRTWADISKSQQILGYNPQTGFSEGIRQFVEWANQNSQPPSLNPPQNHKP